VKRASGKTEIRICQVIAINLAYWVFGTWWTT